MRIGIDMIAVERGRGSPLAQYARMLVERLTTQFTEHDWFLHWHEAAGERAFGQRRAVSGQLALEQSVERPDVWLTTSTLDWLDDYLPPNAPTAATRLAGLVFDLAPALVGERFLDRPNHALRYQRVLQTLPRYDLLLTVSDATRHELISSFGIEPSRVVALGPANDVTTAPLSMPAADSDLLLRDLGIEGPFVLFLAADYEDRSVAVLSAMLLRMPPDMVARYQFAIACRLPIARRLAWQAELERRGQTGRIVLLDGDSSTFVRLCESCEVLVDSSPHEGSGLPLLAALQFPVAAIVDRRSWHAELLGDAALLADVDQPADLAAKLAQLLADTALQSTLRQRASSTSQGASPATVAERAMHALLSVEWALPTKSAPASIPARTLGGRCPPYDAARSKPPLAFFSPLLPQRTGISDYSERLLAALGEHYWIDLYHDHSYLPQLSVDAKFGCRDHRLFERFRRVTEYAGAVYQMANTHYCAYLYEMLLKVPGVVVLHDYALPEFHFGYALRPGVPADFIAGEIAREAPELADDYRTNAASWRAEPSGIMEACIRRGLALNLRVLEAAAVLVVHDEWGADKIRRQHPHIAGRVRVIPHGASVQLASPQEKRAIRQRLGFADDEVILSCFGILNGAKYHSEAIQALVALAGDFPRARLVFAGGDMNEGREQLLVEKLGLTDRVRFFGHAPMKTFLDLMQITDLAMNLRRPPTRGETSGALLSLLSSGVPTVVTDVDTFSSYPNDVVRKIGPLAAGDRSLEHVLRSLLNEPLRRRALSQAAVRHVAEVHNWPRVAQLYANAIEAAEESLHGNRAA